MKPFKLVHRNKCVRTSENQNFRYTETLSWHWTSHRLGKKENMVFKIWKHLAIQFRATVYCTSADDFTGHIRKSWIFILWPQDVVAVTECYGSVTDSENYLRAIRVVERKTTRSLLAVSGSVSLILRFRLSAGLRHPSTHDDSSFFRSWRSQCMSDVHDLGRMGSDHDGDYYMLSRI